MSLTYPAKTQNNGIRTVLLLRNNLFKKKKKHIIVFHHGSRLAYHTLPVYLSTPKIPPPERRTSFMTFVALLQSQLLSVW